MNALIILILLLILNPSVNSIPLWQINNKNPTVKFFQHMKIVERLLDIAGQGLSPYHAEFLKWNNPPSISGIVSIIILGISRWKHKVGQPSVQSLVRLHGCAGWPGSILVAKASLFRCWQDKDLSFYGLLIFKRKIDKDQDRGIPLKKGRKNRFKILEVYKKQQAVNIKEFV